MVIKLARSITTIHEYEIKLGDRVCMHGTVQRVRFQIYINIYSQKASLHII